MFDKPTISEMLVYMGPEILIICFIMLNEIKLKLCGIYFQSEQDLETIQEAIDRNLEKGDEEILKHKKLEKTNMNMKRFFIPTEK